MNPVMVAQHPEVLEIANYGGHFGQVIRWSRTNRRHRFRVEPEEFKQDFWPVADAIAAGCDVSKIKHSQTNHESQKNETIRTQIAA